MDRPTMRIEPRSQQAAQGRATLAEQRSAAAQAQAGNSLLRELCQGHGAGLHGMRGWGTGGNALAFKACWEGFPACQGFSRPAAVCVPFSSILGTLLHMSSDCHEPDVQGLPPCSFYLHSPARSKLSALFGSFKERDTEQRIRALLR